MGINVILAISNTVQGYQPGQEILCTVSLNNGESRAGLAEARQVFTPFYVLFEHLIPPYYTQYIVANQERHDLT